MTKLLTGIALALVFSVITSAQNTQYAITVLPPGGPAPRLSDGHPDFSDHKYQ